MKRMLCPLLALLLLLTAFAAAAETEENPLQGFYLYERRLSPTEDGCMLQLRLYKEGGIQYCLDELDVVLLDANGAEIVPLSQQMIAPLNPVPAGDQSFQVTMVYTLPEGAEAASFQVMNIPGELFNEPAAEPLELAAGHILMHTKDGPAATCWLEKPVSEPRCAGHMMVLHIYDVDDVYLGSQTFSWENATCITPGTQAKAKLAQLSGLSVEVLDYYDLHFNSYSDYYFFADVPLEGLLPDDIPATATSETFRTKSPLTVLTSSFEQLEDGRWRAYCLLQNGSCEPIEFGGHQALLYDEAGELGSYTEVELDCALWELEPFGFTAMQYVFTGLPEGFVPADISVYGKATQRESTYTVKPLAEEHFTVSTENGRMLVTATVPYELCGRRLSNNLSSCAGLIWYARDPADNRMISCGSVNETGEDCVLVGSWTRYKPIEITGVPEGVTPEILMFFIDRK